MSGLGIVRMSGMLESTMAKAIRSASIKLSLVWAIGRDAQKTSGAKRSQMPRRQLAQRAQIGS